MTYAIYKFSFANDVIAVSNASVRRLDSFAVFAVVLSLGLLAAAMFLPDRLAADASAPVSFAQTAPF
jgi:hypothetical protein